MSMYYFVVWHGFIHVLFYIFRPVFWPSYSSTVSLNKMVLISCDWFASFLLTTASSVRCLDPRLIGKEPPLEQVKHWAINWRSKRLFIVFILLITIIQSICGIYLLCCCWYTGTCFCIPVETTLVQEFDKIWSQHPSIK